MRLNENMDNELITLFDIQHMTVDTKSKDDFPFLIA